MSDPNVDSGRAGHSARALETIMTSRRPAVVAMSLMVLLVGCGVASDRGTTEAAPQSTSTPMSPPSGDGMQILRAVVTTTLAPTATMAPATMVEPTSGILRSIGRPDHLRTRRDDLVPRAAAVIVAPGAADSSPTNQSRDVDATPAPVTTVRPPVTTVPPPATTVPPQTTVPPSTTAPSTTAPPVPTTTVPPATTTVPPTPNGSAAATFASQVNGVRAGAGVAALSRSADLDARAQAWAEYMAGSGDFRHSNISGDLIAGGWSIAGENIGKGPSVESVFGGLAASSGHYANMVNPSFTSLGVGVAVDGNGVLWTTHVFAG